jgi:hypothetical protein
MERERKREREREERARERKREGAERAWREERARRVELRVKRLRE